MNTDVLSEYLQAGMAWFGTIVAAASVIVKATPTQKDDAVLAKIIKILDCVSVFNAKIQTKNDDERQ